MPVIMYKGIPYGEGTNTLDGLKDVNISNPSSDDVVKYDSSTGKFVNGQLALSALSDIDLTNLQDGQIIKWDATAGKFVNANESGGGSSITVLSGTLTAGTTSITFTDASILADSVVSCATPAGINPTAMTSSVGTVTFYFASQGADMVVKAVIF